MLEEVFFKKKYMILQSQNYKDENLFWDYKHWSLGLSLVQKLCSSINKEKTKTKNWLLWKIRASILKLIYLDVIWKLLNK